MGLAGQAAQRGDWRIVRAGLVGLVSGSLAGQKASLFLLQRAAGPEKWHLHGGDGMKEIVLTAAKQAWKALAQAVKPLPRVWDSWLVAASHIPKSSEN